MVYRDNVTELAAKQEISNDPRLCEEDIEIASLRFFNHNGTESVVAATDMNRAGRLFIQDYATICICGSKIRFTKLTCNDRLRTCAAQYFAELWEENPVPGKRPLIDGIRNFDFIAITYKWENE